MTSDPLEILVRHYQWANGVLLDRCDALTQAQFHQKFEIGLESLHDTLCHIIGCVDSWTARVGGSLASKHPTPQTVVQLRERNESSTQATRKLIQDTVAKNELNRRFTTRFTGSTGEPVDVTLTVGATIMHMLTHGQYHRAQAVNMLRQLNLGIAIPELDVSDWQYETENKQHEH